MPTLLIEEFLHNRSQIEKAAITRGQFGVQITINGIRISQSDNDGTVVVVDRNDRKLELNPTYGYGHIWGSGGHVGITAEGRAEIHLLNRHIIAAEDQIEVSIGGRQAHFDGHLWLEPTIE